MKCENCSKEHDGTYGSGRFCSKHCRMQWVGRIGHKIALERGNFKSGFSACDSNRKPLGTWKCSICGKILETRQKLEKHKTETHPSHNRVAWNKGLTKEIDKRVAQQSSSLKMSYASGKIIPPGLGKSHTDAERRRISETMKRKIATGEIEAPYKRNHCSKGPSYPERYFIDVFKNAGISVEYNFQVGFYQLDFANPKTKKYVEIDGDQHYLDERIVKHDIERTENLKNIGWELMCRIKWSDFQKLTQVERNKVCGFLINSLY